VKVILGLVALLLASGVVAQAQTPAPGAKYRGDVQVAGRTIPLLDGEWMVASTSSSPVNGGTIVRVVLAQMAGSRLSRWVYIVTNDGANPAGWNRNKLVCDRNDVHTGYSDTLHTPRESSCWILNHMGQTLGSNPPQAMIDFYRWSDNRGRPNTALALVYYFARNGDHLYVEYSFNPVMAGFPDTPDGVWRGNPWHVDIASKDPRKLAYLRQLKSTGEMLYEKLRTVLR
jgi:hypothetical protein